MEWIDVNDRLPEFGKYVLARHNRGTWVDGSDQENVNCVVVKLVKGVSIEERAKMKAEGNQNWRRESGFDEGVGNNQKPYGWQEFGPDSFFGQQITHWTPIPKAPEQ